MPELGRYAKLPRPESFQVFERHMNIHRKVSGFTRLSEQIYKIERNNGFSDIIVFITNIYTVSDAEVFEILEENQNVNCILTISAWNGYTKRGKEMARNQFVGLFTFSEFIGAINYDGEQLLDYISREERERLEREKNGRGRI
ncbi:hypothetical protein [Bacillus cereus]|uniref:hypothetical protein n=1 Tax=Bacillus cereus TaxID=1396 RepID=UPI000B4985E9|nr:hypothetical protein [Bacillus cereus]